MYINKSFFLAVALFAQASACMELKTSLTLNHPKNNATDLMQHIAGIIKEYTRPITVLEINPPNDDVAQWLVQNYHATVIEWVNLQYQKELMRSWRHELTPAHDHIILLNKPFTPQDLTSLTECEHFDLVVVYDLKAVDTLHSQENLDLILTLGEVIIVSACNVDGSFDLFYRKKLYLNRRSWNACDQLALGSNYIQSTKQNKIIHDFANNSSTPMPIGIQLKTFIALNGIWPDRSTILGQLRMIAERENCALDLATLFIQGKKIVHSDFFRR